MPTSGASIGSVMARCHTYTSGSDLTDVLEVTMPGLAVFAKDVVSW